MFDPDPSAGGLEVLGGVFAALVGVHDHLAEGVLAAKARDRHLQCGLGLSALWCLPRANPAMNIN
jgi:hypothetical protein